MVEYSSGEEMLTDRRFKKLRYTPDLHVWELKTDEVRIFGWVPEKDAFICCYGDSKDKIELEESYGRYIALTSNIRNCMNLDDPKCVEHGEYQHVISTKD